VDRVRVQHRDLLVTLYTSGASVRRLFFSAFVRVQVALYRASGTRLGGRLRKGVSVLHGNRDRALDRKAAHASASTNCSGSPINEYEAAA
jgi:hypothetical protein